MNVNAGMRNLHGLRASAPLNLLKQAKALQCSVYLTWGGGRT